MTRETAPNLTDDDRRFLEESRRIAAEEKAVEPSTNPGFAARMQFEAEIGAYLDSPEGAEAKRILNMPRDEFEDEFADILNADAYDEEDGVARSGDSSS